MLDLALKLGDRSDLFVHLLALLRHSVADRMGSEIGLYCLDAHKRMLLGKRAELASERIVVSLHSLLMLFLFAHNPASERFFDGREKRVEHVVAEKHQRYRDESENEHSHGEIEQPRIALQDRIFHCSPHQ